HLDPVLGREHLRETLEPAFVVAALLRTRPDAELLAVVAQHHDAIRSAFRYATQDVDGIARLAKRDRVAQLAVDREHADRLALVFRAETAPELLALQPGSHEV